MDGRSLCAYNTFIRPAYVDAVLSLGWDAAAADRGASWGSLKNILLHVVEVEDWWFHHAAAGRQAVWQDWQLDDVATADAFLERMRAIEAKTRTFLDGLGDRDLTRPVTILREDGVTNVYEMGDVLVHVAIEEVHHRGELIALLWQLDREPPPMTYLRWVRHRTGQA